MYRTDFWTLWEKARVGCFKRTASKHVYYLGWNRSPAQVGCMRQVLGPGALGRARGIGWRGRWEGGLGWGIHVNPCLIHVSVWQKPLQYCKVISLQLIKINEKKKKRNEYLNPEGSIWVAHHTVCLMGFTVWGLGWLAERRQRKGKILDYKGQKNTGWCVSKIFLFKESLQGRVGSAPPGQLQIKYGPVTLMVLFPAVSLRQGET